MKIRSILILLLSSVSVFADEGVVCSFDTPQETSKIGFWKSSTSSAACKFEAGKGINGTGCNSFVFKDSQQKNGICLNHLVPLKRGVTYTVTACVKAVGMNDSDEIGLNIQQRTADGGYSPNLPSVVSRNIIEVAECRDWKEIQTAVTVNAADDIWKNVANLGFTLGAGSQVSGQLFIDRLSIEISE